MQQAQAPEETYAIPASLLQAIISAIGETPAQGFARIGRDGILGTLQALTQRQDKERAEAAEAARIQAAVTEAREASKKG
jgi:hypothetical protein